MSRSKSVSMSEHEEVHHPDHYGGADDPYEAIRVIEAWEANFNVGNALKYLRRYKMKNGSQDLRKAVFYILREARTLDRLGEDKEDDGE